MTEPDQTPFATWCIVEQMGHRRLVGHVTEVQIAGAGFLRLDEIGTDDSPGRTQFLAPASIFALHPVDEAMARAAVRPADPWSVPELTAEPDGTEPPW